jgi:hypothetical protein
MAVAALACGGAAWAAAELVADLGAVVQVVVGVLAGAAAYGVLLVAFRVDEVDTIVRMVRSRMRARSTGA